MKTALFLSPHLDDAAFSAGAMMQKLKQQGMRVRVINVCSSGGVTPETLSARAFLRQIHEPSATILYAKRRSEDAAAIASIGVEAVNLDFVEALWRKLPDPSLWRRILGSILPEFLHVYPTYKFHVASGKIASADEVMIQAVAARLRGLIDPETIVFCPLGIGGHIDHVVTRHACEKLGVPLVYWADIPYVVRPHAIPSPVDTTSLTVIKIDDATLLNAKAALCARYPTQYQPVFGTIDPASIPEQFYGAASIMQTL